LFMISVGHVLHLEMKSSKCYR